MSTATQTINHQVVSQKEWIAAGKELLAKEKELTKHRDELARLRRALPWTEVTTSYTFDSTSGEKTLSELFGDKTQLIAYHFMYAPGDTEGCPGCSFISDHVDCARQHFEHHDIAYVAVSRAPLAEFQAFKKRMGWTFDWVSSNGNDFNYDLGVSYHPEDYEKGPVLHNFVEQKLSSEEQPGLSVFIKDADGRIFHTYSTFERGLDTLIGAYSFIDLTPIGRNEKHAMDWMHFHDKY